MEQDVCSQLDIEFYQADILEPDSRWQLPDDIYRFLQLPQPLEVQFKDSLPPSL